LLQPQRCVWSARELSGMVPRVDGAEAEYRRGVQPAEVGVRETRRLQLFGELGIQTAGAGAKLLEEGVPVERDSAGPQLAGRRRARGDSAALQDAGEEKLPEDDALPPLRPHDQRRPSRQLPQE